MSSVVSQHNKLLLYLLIILKYFYHQSDYEALKFQKLLEDDIEFCPTCFSLQKTQCNWLQENVKYNQDLTSTIHNFFGTKHVSYGELKNAGRIVIKYLGGNEKSNYILNGLANYTKDRNIGWIRDQNETTIEHLRQLFFHESRIDGLQFCPPEKITSFSDIFINEKFTLLDVWILLHINIQPLLIPLLNELDFPIPKIYGSCGFTIYQSYEGIPLTQFYSKPFEMRLTIAEKLLDAALRFTEGFGNYRIYLTDINPDNIVFNEETMNISFIDLDSVIIVDSQSHFETKSIYLDNVHKHEIIDCNGCFAFVPSEICSHSKSDLNLFAVCQMLQSDLYGDRGNGFLHNIPDEIKFTYPNFEIFLEECVTCNFTCNNRFKSANLLLKLVHNITKQKAFS